MPQLRPIELAEVAYRAYGDWTGGKNFLGDPMPEWDALPEQIQHAWVAAVGAVERAILAPPGPPGT